LQKKLWALVSKRIRKERPICEMCGKRPATQVHHIFSRRFKATMFDENNLVSICSGCHMKAHFDPEWARSLYIAKLGQAEYESLYLKANSQTLNWNIPDYLEAIKIERKRAKNV
jgi:5-methylcytosine-specific restriction endonuclease McrA